MTPEELAAAMIAMMPFTKRLDIEPVSAAADRVVARVPWSEELCTAGGTLHGGMLMALADAAGAACAFLNLPADSTTTTIESKTNFLRGVRSGHVEAVASPIHVGRTIIVIEVELRDDNNKLVAKTTATQAVLSAS